LEKQYHAVAIVPAYNEQDIIRQTIESLMVQTYQFDYVLVVANNCTDSTVSIVESLLEKYENEKLCMVVMEKNPGLKAGALNYGLSLVDSNIDFVFTMDGDTIVHEDIVRAGLEKFRREPTTGGICSAYRTMPLKETATRWQRFLWRAQNIEFSLANAWRVENFDSARVLPGVATMFRMAALQCVKQYHQQQGLGDNIVWVPGCQVEDYLLTVQLKDLGWGTKSSHDMVSWSDVPLKLNGPGGLWRQRRRWYSGTIDVLRERKLKKNSRYELFTISLLMVNLCMRWLLVASYIALVIIGRPIELIPIFLLLPVVAIVMQLYRLKKFGDQLDRWQYLFTATLVVNELYAAYREILYAYSIWLSYRRPKRSW